MGGSNGGTGPGIDRGRDGLPLPKSQSSVAFGSIYRRLGCELADAGTVYDWRFSPVDAAAIAAGGTCGRSSVTATPAVCKVGNDPFGKPPRLRKPAVPSRPTGSVAMLHMSWRHTYSGKKWPTFRRLKLVSSLQIAANDIVATVNFMRAKYGCHLPVVLVGFSFGGPAAWAAASKLVVDGSPPAGVVALAGSGRDGAAFRAQGLETLGCMDRCMKAGVAGLLLHGTDDHNVAIEVPHYFYSNLTAAGSAVLTLAVVLGAEHIFDLARDIVFAALKEWILACVGGLNSGVLSVAPCGPGPVAIQLHGGGRAEPFPVRKITREFLLSPFREHGKGYSEKVGKSTCTTLEEPQPSPRDSTPEHSSDERQSSKQSSRSGSAGYPNSTTLSGSRDEWHAPPLQAELLLDNARLPPLVDTRKKK